MKHSVENDENKRGNKMKHSLKMMKSIGGTNETAQG